MSSSSVSATVAVDKATSDLLLVPDWTTNMEICDSVNSLHWQAKDVVKAVKKRLQHKSPRVQLLALTLLETLVKNCGDYLHHQVAEKNILGEMVKIVKKKADMQVRDKILGMLESWRLAFGGPEGKYPQYFWTYEELRRSGVEFPPRSPDASPILTPPASHPPLRPPQGGYGIPQLGYGTPQVGYGTPQVGYGVPQVGYGIPQVGYGMPSGSSTRLDEAMANEVEGLSLSSLESMRDVMDLLSDMLQAVDPSDRTAVRDEVIVDLVERCRSNQKKLMQMLTSTGDEELLGRGLDLNDSLQTLLARHDAIASGSPLPIQTSKPIESSPKSSEAKDSSSIAGSSSPIPASISTGKTLIDEDYEEEEDEFTQLALRHSKPAPVPNSDSQKSLTADIGVGNALALPDPPPPVNTTKEQDMIDLLSITLSTDPTPSPPSAQPRPPVSDQNYHFGPQPLPYESYVAPWALPHQPRQQPPQTQPGYFNQTRPDQGFPPQVNQATATQFETQQPTRSDSQTYTGSQTEPPTRPQYVYPPPPWASTPNNSSQTATSGNAYYTPRANATSSYAATSTQAGRSLQQSNSFPTRTGDPQATSGANNTGLATGPKPFVPSYRLFEDLDVFGNADGKLNKSTNSNATQSMIGGRK